MQDDLLILMRASNSDATNGKQILEQFSRMSGQVVNFDQYGLIISKGVRGMQNSQLKQILNTKKLGQDKKYIGNHLFLKREKA